jgi:putative FmdB family regulatory protein
MPIYEYKCQACGEFAEILVRTPGEAQKVRCPACDSPDLTRLVSRPALIRSQGSSDSGELRPVDPRKAVEGMSRMYDRAGIDPGQGFSEVAKRAAAGDSPDTLKEAVKEAKKNEASTKPAKSGN